MVPPSTCAPSRAALPRSRQPPYPPSAAQPLPPPPPPNLTPDGLCTSALGDTPGPHTRWSLRALPAPAAQPRTAATIQGAPAAPNPGWMQYGCSSGVGTVPSKWSNRDPNRSYSASLKICQSYSTGSVCPPPPPSVNSPTLSPTNHCRPISARIGIGLKPHPALSGLTFSDQ
jgi:hypothetical protein